MVAKLKLKQPTNQLMQKLSFLSNRCSNSVECSFDSEVETCAVSDDITQCLRVNLNLIQNSEECRRVTFEKGECRKSKGQIGKEKGILKKKCCEMPECVYDCDENTCLDRK